MSDSSNSPNSKNDYYFLDPEHVDPARIKREREKARKLRKSQWWLRLANQGICHYCQKKFAPNKLTMDHVVPLARGGTSTPGNIVPSCQDCNRDKKLSTPAEELLKNLGAPETDGSNENKNEDEGGGET
jgi:5-methylcytosine-specific restriction endonuclease McrA